MKKITAWIIITVFVFSFAACAGAPKHGVKKDKKQEEELRADQFQKDIGAILVIGGMAGGAYMGSRMSGGEGVSGLTSGFIGGIAGGVAAGLTYWLVLQVVGEKAKINDREEPEQSVDILMPED